MVNVVYLVIFVLAGGDGVTSQAIPQANMVQCQANAKIFNAKPNKEILVNAYSSAAKTQVAYCIVGVK